MSAGSTSLSARSFRIRFRNLIILAWTGPPVVGLLFLLFIRMFSAEQMLGILTSLLEPAFIIGTFVFAVVYFSRYIAPVERMLDKGDGENTEMAERAMRRFPLHFWVIFLVYLLLAPSSVIVSAELYTSFVASPVDWFRIHLVALIVSIIVGLPIFFMILDLFGKALGTIRLTRAHVTIKVKGFMIGALVPLLIDTMLVQYYWTRTGFFNMETFVVWLSLEVLAIIGSIFFVRSYSQSLSPLQGWISSERSLSDHAMDQLLPRSTDELGVMTNSYRELIDDWRIHNEILEINTRILRSSGKQSSLGEVIDAILTVCQEIVGDDMVFLILPDRDNTRLIGVAQTGGTYLPEGYYQLGLDDQSTAAWIYNNNKSVVILDAEHDERVSPVMRQRFEVKATIGMPLQAGGKCIGVLMSTSKNPERVYAEREQMLIEGVAREVSVAVQTFELYESGKAAETALKDHEEFLRLLMSATEEGIYGVDTQGICIFINPAGVRMLGYDSEDELLGNSIHEMIHHTYPDGRPYPKDQCAVKMATQKGESGHSDEELHWRKDGSGIPVEYWSHPIYKDGVIVGTVVTFIDITERKKTFEKLEYQAQVIDQVRDSIVATDLAGNVTSWNKGAERLFGYTEEHMLGRSIAVLYPEEEFSEVKAMIARFRDQGMNETEVRMRRKDGSVFYASLSLSMLYDDAGEPVGVIGYSVDITDRKADQESLRHQAYHDKLTDLPNRWLLQDRIAQNIAIAGREDRCGALMFLDLDRFKKINDTLGHEFGDEVLLAVASRLKAQLRDGDTLARLGGDEFVLLLTNLNDIAEAAEVASRVLEDIKEPFMVRDREVHLGGSIGIAGYPEHGSDADTLLKHADFAMYRAKEKGGDNFQYYTADIHQEANERFQLEHELRRAIYSDELFVCYQPQYDMHTGNVVGLEALCRWESPGLGTVTPDQFIPIAEETGLIIPLGEHVVRCIAKDVGDWVRRGIRPPRVAINLSAQQVRSSENIKAVMQLAQQPDLGEASFEIEITESSLMDDPVRAEKILGQLKEYGVRVAIDDFGTGYSSLGYLKRYPVDVLKIDRSFISDITRDADDEAIVETIIGMASNLGLEVIAEGIETAEQAEFLKRKGCRIAQGFYFSRPVDAGKCVELLGGN
jgi:diguanylate cyclase (GGDEF)-like protein/PAS domain S-box-containing protein